MIDNAPDEWTADAVCRTVDPELFFPEGRLAWKTVKIAKSICATCPVQLQCGAEGLSIEVPQGVWSGEYFGTNPERREKAFLALEAKTGVKRAYDSSTVVKVERESRTAKVHELTKMRMSANEIATLVGVTPRQVQRDRSAVPA